MSKGKKITIGYKYYLGIQYALCYGPVDALTEVQVGELQAWTGSQTANGVIAIDKPDLFGGEKKEGGIVGDLHVALGGPSQTQNTYLQSKIGPNIPAYRGLLTLVFNGMVSAMSPYIKPWSFRVRRILQGWNGGTPWYSAKAQIGNDMNPAHIVYECLTNPDWGMGYPSNTIDATSFTAAADTLFSESFGISLLWNRSDKIATFLQQIMNHIGGTLAVDRKTGLFELKLHRAGYDINTLPEINVSNAVLESWQRAAWGETSNEISLVYTNPNNGKERVISAQDLANIDIQGAIVNQKINMPGITTDALAQRVLMRELRIVSTPLAKAKIKINRSAWDWGPGDVVRLNWAPLGIDGAYIVLSINWGTLDDNTITVDLAEDIYGLPQSSYSGQQAVGWTEPSTLPAASPLRFITETPYYDLARTLSAADLDYLDITDCRIDVYAQRPSGDCLDYNLWTAAGSAALEDRGTGSHQVTALTTAEITASETSTIQLDDISELSATAGGYVVMGGEYMRLDSYNIGAGTVTVARGVLDTVPKTHAAGSLMWFADDQQGQDEIDYLPGDSVKIKVQTKTGRGVLDINATPQDTYTPTSRQARPYPPGQFRLGGNAFPGYVSGARVNVAWAHRNRLTQTASIIPQDSSSITPETGTTYNVQWLDTSNNVLRSRTDISGTSTYATFIPPNEDIVLLHFDGANGSSVTVDETGKPVTGTATLSTTQSVFGGASVYFDAAVSKLTMTAPVQTFPSGQFHCDDDYTVEFWARPTDASGSVIRWMFYADGVFANRSLAIGHIGTTLRIHSLVNTEIAIISSVITINAWQHIAVTRSSGVGRVFVGGVLRWTGSLFDLGSNSIQIGGAASENNLIGWIDEFRFRKGAMYTAGFTVPASPFGLVAIPAVINRVRVTVESARDGYLSWQKHDWTVDLSGYGLNYGNYYGAGAGV